MAPRTHPPEPSSSTQTAHNLAVLTEYTHTLDSLPLDLSRNYGDLRELDAVLSSSMSILTHKVVQLTEMIESRAATKDERLWLLAEIADEARKLKPGADDKIRVASQSADAVKAHKAHMSTLLDHMPDTEFGKMAGTLDRKTVFPHVSQRSFVSFNNSGEGSRRARRGGAGHLLANNVDATPHKRKRAVGRDEDGELAVVKSPRKERVVDGHRPRNNGRSRKPERAASPAESLLSVASHIPNGPSTAQQHLGASQARQTTTGRAASTVSAIKRLKTQQAHAPDPNQHVEANGHRNDLINAPPPSSSAGHPSLPTPYVNGSQSKNEVINGRAVSNGLTEWATGQLEGPGMPVARNFTPAAASAIQDEHESLAGGQDGDADGDDQTLYCFCQGVSYGAMIACEDPGCEREWFHLGCVGLKEAPDGDWICDSCRSKRTAKRSGRGGKRRAGGGRGGRNTSA